MLYALLPPQSGTVRFLPSMTCRNILSEPPEMDVFVTERPRVEQRAPDDYLLIEGVLERREQTRYYVRALVDFEWTDGGVTRRGQGLTRDISRKGMFIYSDINPPAKADLLVDVSFRDVSSIPSTLQMRAKGLVIRVEPATEQGSQQGFAILNRSYELRNDVNTFQN